MTQPPHVTTAACTRSALQIWLRFLHLSIAVLNAQYPVGIPKGLLCWISLSLSWPCHIWFPWSTSDFTTTFISSKISKAATYLPSSNEQFLLISSQKRYKIFCCSNLKTKDNIVAVLPIKPIIWKRMRRGGGDRVWEELQKVRKGCTRLNRGELVLPSWWPQVVVTVQWITYCAIYT